MAACTFFGHHDCPSDIRSALRNEILLLFFEQGVTTFYVGHQGAFDRMAAGVLRELSKLYPQICYSIVWAYLPAKTGCDEHWQNTLYPDGIERVPRRYAIPWRNRWMLQRSTYVITYVAHSCGGAAQFEHMALRQGKTVINLYRQQI